MNAGDFAIRWIGGSERTELHVGCEVRQYDTDWHFHQDWQVIHVTAAERIFEWRGGAATVRKGQTLILPPDFVHRGRNSERAASFIMLYVSPATVGISRADSLTLLHDRTLAKTLTQAASEGSDPGWVKTIRSIFTGTRFRPAQRRTSIPTAVSRTKVWLEEHQNYLNCFEKLGAIGDCNPFYMSHLFRRWAGLSPRSFRLQIRLLEARRRISQGQAIARVAADLGFADQSHLARQFKRAFGLTPGRYSCLSRPRID